jgi:hypothetical protein
VEVSDRDFRRYFRDRARSWKTTGRVPALCDYFDITLELWALKGFEDFCAKVVRHWTLKGIGSAEKAHDLRLERLWDIFVPSLIGVLAI